MGAVEKHVPRKQQVDDLKHRLWNFSKEDPHQFAKDAVALVERLNGQLDLVYGPRKDF